MMESISGFDSGDGAPEAVLGKTVKPYWGGCGVLKLLKLLVLWAFLSSFLVLGLASPSVGLLQGFLLLEENDCICYKTLTKLPLGSL